MSDHTQEKIEYLTLIAGRKDQDQLVRTLREAGGQLIHVQYAKSSDTAGLFMDMLGLLVEKKKVVITCLLPGSISDAVLDRLTGQYRLDQPNTGVAFTLPVEYLSL